MGLPFQNFRWSWEFSTGISKKFVVNGKQPLNACTLPAKPMIPVKGYPQNNAFSLRPCWDSTLKHLGVTSTRIQIPWKTTFFSSVPGPAWPSDHRKPFVTIIFGLRENSWELDLLNVFNFLKSFIFSWHWKP